MHEGRRMLPKFAVHPIALLGFALALLCSSVFAQTAKTEVLWLGQSAFRITSPGGKVIVIDPWLRLNPLTPPESLPRFNKGGTITLAPVSM
jgi:hypothetical protein